jgi:hypothetical protein
MASCALRSLAADTIFMALVICRVDLTELRRILISFRFAIVLKLVVNKNHYLIFAITSVATSESCFSVFSVSLPCLSS